MPQITKEWLLEQGWKSACNDFYTLDILVLWETGFGWYLSIKSSTPIPYYHKIERENDKVLTQLMLTQLIDILIKGKDATNI